MWILVLSPAKNDDSASPGTQALRQLGCEVLCYGLRDLPPLARPKPKPPAAILVEAPDDIDAARRALSSWQQIAGFSEVPALLAVSVNGIQRIQAHDGFDDFVLMPYVPAELYMRIRRIEWQRSEFSSQEILKIGNVALNLAAHEVTVDDRQVELTHQEFALLRFLCLNRGRVFSREQLLQQVWDVDYYGSSRTVDIHVRRLRSKLRKSAKLLETVRGVGYKCRTKE